MQREQRVVIVGGGVSGVLVAAHLARHSSARPRRVSLIDRRAEMGAGTAFGTRRPCHLLNVPAARMSGFVDDPEHFLRWARAVDPSVRADTYVPRALYGDYLRDVLHDARFASSPTEIELRSGEVAAIETHDGHARVRLADGAALDADVVVLALGNSPPADPFVADPAFYSSARYTHDPWRGAPLDHIARDDEVLLVGTGLTAVDVVLALVSRGHRGAIHAVSRHGLLPLAHVPCPPAERLELDAVLHARSARALVHAIRAEVARAATDGTEWRAVIDGLRPHTQAVWANLPACERRRVVHHAARYWEVHRHRMAPPVARQMHALLAQGRFTVERGRVTAFDEQSNDVVAHLLHRGRPRALRVAHVVNCTGPRPDIVNARDRVVDGLVAAGAVRAGPLDLGLDTDAAGRLLDACGRASAVLYTLGSLRRGGLWETTAVAEIRAQAGALADALLATPVS